MVCYYNTLEDFPQFVVIHIYKGFSIVSEAEADVFLEFPCFLHDPMNADNLISGSSASSKPCLYMCTDTPANICASMGILLFCESV